MNKSDDNKQSKTQKKEGRSNPIETIVNLRDGWEKNCGFCKHTVEEHELIDDNCPFCDHPFIESVW